MVDIPPTRVPIITQDTPVQLRVRPATEKSEADFTLDDCLIANSVIRAKVVLKVTGYRMLST